MQWLLQNWQTLAALGVVGITAAIFAWRMLRRDNRSCGGTCDCPTKKGAPASGDPGPTGKHD